MNTDEKLRCSNHNSTLSEFIPLDLQGSNNWKNIQGKREITSMKLNNCASKIKTSPTEKEKDTTYYFTILITQLSEKPA